MHSLHVAYASLLCAEAIACLGKVEVREVCARLRACA